MENNLSKPFSPKDIESHWYDFWESKGFYQAGLDTKQKKIHFVFYCRHPTSQERCIWGMDLIKHLWMH